MFNSSGECFLVSNLASALVNFNLELAPHTIDDDLEVKLTHSTKDGLTCIFICVHTQSRILFNEFGNCHTHLVNVGLCLRLDCHGDYRLRNEHVLECNRMIFVAESITGLDFLETNGRADITSLDKIDWVLLVGKHLHDTA